MNETPDAADSRSVQWQFPRFRWILLAGLGVVLAFWLVPLVAEWASKIDFSSLDRPYSIVFAFVMFDAVIPIFPSESLLTSGATLAAQSDSAINIWRLFAAGALGAVAGDSMLYWLSRTVLRPTMAARVEAAQENETVSRMMQVLDTQASLIIVFGRFIPGLRFMVGATMGLSRFPFKRFLLWDAVGSIAWAGSTCLFSYAIGSIMNDRPIASILASVIITTGLLALLFRPIKKGWEDTGAETGVAT